MAGQPWTWPIAIAATMVTAIAVAKATPVRDDLGSPWGGMSRPDVELLDDPLCWDSLYTATGAATYASATTMGY